MANRTNHLTFHRILLNSMYELKKPYDLIAFLDQEKKVQQLADLYEGMVRWKKIINIQSSRLNSFSFLFSNFSKSNSDCIGGIDLYFLIADTAVDRIPSNSNLEDADSKEENDKEDEDDELDCERIVPLEFSMATFPHLEVLTEPWDISWSQEVNIDIPLTIGQIRRGLIRNQTSWYLHNMASLYWRRKGNGQRALDCAKRALHLASREFKDTPLLNLGGMLLRAKYLAEATLLLHSAVDHAPHRPHNHFVLANVYAVLGDYNRSMTYYDNALDLDPDWASVKKTKNAVICWHKLEQLFTQIDSFMKDIISQMNDYQKWLTSQEELLKTNIPLSSLMPPAQGDICATDISLYNLGRSMTPLTFADLNMVQFQKLSADVSHLVQAILKSSNQQVS